MTGVFAYIHNRISSMFSRLFIAIVFLCSASQIKAQKNSIDSLQELIKSTRIDTIKVNASNQVADLLRKKGRHQDALTYVSSALELAEKIKFKKGIGKAHLVKGNIHRVKSEYDDALLHFTKALDIYRPLKDKPTMAIIYGNIGLCYSNKGNLAKAIEYYNLDLQTCEELKDKKAMGYSLNNLGLVYSNKGEFDKALEYYERGLKLDEDLKNKSGEAISLNNIGLVYFDKGNLDKAFDYFFRSLKIKEDLNDKKGIAASYNNIGNIYNRKKDMDKSIEYYEKSLKIREEIGDRKGAAVSINNIGSIYSDRNENKKALEYYERALKIREEMGDVIGLASSYINVGNIYLKEKDYAKTLDYYNKSIDLNKQIGDKKGIAVGHYVVSSVYLSKKEYDKCRENAMLSLRYSREMKVMPDVKNALQNLALCEYGDGKFKEAYEYYLHYTNVKDSIFNEDSNKQISEIQTKYDTEKKEAQIALLSKDQELQLKELEKQKLMLDKSAKEKLLLANENEIKQLAILQSKAALKQKQIEADNEHKQNDLLRKDKLLKDAEVREHRIKVEQQRVTIFFFAVGIGLIFLLAIFIYRGYRLKLKANRIISLQKEKVEHQKELLEEKNKEILDSITYAQHLQQAILPPMKMVNQFLPDSFILYKPKDIVAGDFYWLETHNNHLFFAAADCTGHGVPGAMVSVVCSNALNRAVKEFNLIEPGKILNKVRELVIETFEKSESEVKDGMDISLVALALQSWNQSEGGKYRSSLSFSALKWAGANNPLWISRKGEEKMIEFQPVKQSIGKNEIPEDFVTHSIELKKGDCLYLFTDGYADQFGGEEFDKGKGKKYKYARLNKFLLSISELSINDQKEKLDAEFENWRGQLEQIDDVCILGVRIN